MSVNQDRNYEFGESVVEIVAPSRRVLEWVDKAIDWNKRNGGNAQINNRPEPTSANKAETDDINDMGSDEIIAEIHQLRSDFRELQQVTEKLLHFEGSLTNIAQASESKPIKPQICIILDTNVLLLNMNFIKSLKDRHGSSKSVAVVIPFAVQQELDILRYVQSQKPHLKSLAAQAFRMICALLVESNFPVWAEKCSSEYYNKAEFEANGTKIINCCLQYKKKFNCEVILFSGDHVIADEAFRMGIDVCPVAKLSVFLRMRFPLPEASAAKEVIEERDGDLKALFVEWSTTLMNVLGGIFTVEMKAIYGSEWLNVVMDKPPWTLYDLLKCFEKHWDKELLNLVNRDASMSLRKLLDEMNLNPKPTNLQKLDVLLNASQRFLSYFEQLPNHTDHVKEAIEKFKQIKKRLIKQIGRVNLANDDEAPENEGMVLLDQASSSGFSFDFATPDFVENEFSYLRNVVVSDNKSELEIVKSAFARIWNFMHYSCGMIIDSLGGKSPLVYSKPTILPSKRDTFEFIGRFYPALINIKSCLAKYMLVSGSTSLARSGYSLNPPNGKQKENPYEDLGFALEDFLYSLFKEIEMHPREILTPDMLKKFSENQNARALMRCGLCQLDIFIALVNEQMYLQDGNETAIQCNISK